MSSPTTTKASPIRELTLRAIILGGVITLVFTAANVYLGLKVGLTFATSIPAAVISMAILRKFAGHTIMENNIVQTIASAAGTLSAIIFVLPGLVMVGWWAGFPYWTTLAICLVGGVLGVMYSIPLRRALVTGSDLPYPEGVAAAEVLKVGDEQGSAEENKAGLRVIVAGAAASAGYALLSALKATASSVSSAFKIGTGGSVVGASLSVALIGVGHLVGVTVGIAMLVGVSISHGVLLPIFSQDKVGADVAGDVSAVFSAEVRFVGAGTMAVAAVWTLLKIIGPIFKGMRESFRSSQSRHSGVQVPLTDRDIPFPIVLTVIIGSMIPIGFMLWKFVHNSEIHHHATSLVLVSVLFTLLIGLLVAAVCGYMAGLIGASNSPISGVGIITVLAAALMIKAVTGDESDTNPTALVAYTLFTAAIIFGISTISNDNLQDLKTGQLVGATPWKQQVALVIGVFFGSLIIPPIMQLMLTAFGFQGMDGAGPDALAAPQAALMSSVTQGIFGDSLDWSKIGLGAIIGVVVIIIDEVLGRVSGGRYHLPPLAVGMGLYLPAGLNIMIAIGGFLGLFYNKWAARQQNPETTKRMGTLMATGLIVGESLFGVLNAGLIAAAGGDEPLAVFGENFPANAVGIVVFVLLIGFVYRWVRTQAKTV
ncbi:metal-nicotianamine transporter YSL2 [Corynebacterium renale]|uniref:Putative OPT family oligopeptide transporter n=1 Tax=Corynebacterium renale TaxID=1724 RepID=A0A2A9DLF8_9CORY|nr:oligopeptide transporter, OPT family [Corynebacterium renale]PFG27433.1 putative OPT family oligopeptide transporter [Corynebacterium renale]SQG63876.1 metal-nicotianamine transporter YSL2 [Corynebacterium renale]SQI23395.1 metal-nicotianamine transporter YSL2 [Corynebacterium renale]STD02591.1 metal-nicotianamine transporter YSL2 [Corynebacterium renale]